MSKYKVGDRVKFRYKGWGDKRPITKTGKIIMYRSTKPYRGQEYEIHTGGEKYYFVSARKPAKGKQTWGYIVGLIKNKRR